MDSAFSLLYFLLKEINPKDGIHGKRGMEQKESIDVNTGVLEATCSLSQAAAGDLFLRKPEMKIRLKRS